MATKLGKPVRFPRTQAEIAEWRKKYTWDPKTKKWYEPAHTKKTKETKTPTFRPTSLKPGELPPGAVRDPVTGKIYYPGGLKQIGAGISEIATQTKKLGTQVSKVLSAADLKEKTSVPSPTFEETKPEDALKGIDQADVTASTVIDTVDFWKQQYEKVTQQLTDIQKKQQGLLDKLLGKPEETYEEALKRIMAEYGIPEKLDKLQAQAAKVAQLQGKMSQLDVQMTAEIDKQYQRRVPMPEIEAAIDEIKRDYTIRKAYLAAQLNAEAAVMQAYQGNLAEAQNLVKMAVNAYAADLEMERRNYEVLFNYYSDFISDLTNEQRRILEQGYQEALRREQEAKAEKEQVLNLKLQYPEAGIGVDDSLDEATQKVEDYLKSIPPAEEEVLPPERWPTSYREWVLAGSPGSYEEWLRKEEMPESEVKNAIISKINSAVDQYRLNPEGFRERFIESLVRTYGEEWRDYITESVYTLMPDIAQRRFITKEFLRLAGEDELYRQAKEAGYGGLFKKRGKVIEEYLNDLMKTIEAYRQAGFSDEEILRLMRSR